MLYFDGRSGSSKLIQLRKKNLNCTGCSDLTLPIAYVPMETCGISSENLGYKELSVFELSTHFALNITLVDVRPAHHFEICSLKCSINIPANLILKMKSIDEFLELIPNTTTNICILCRRGVDSVTVSNYLLKLSSDQLNVFNLTGGLVAWANNIDPNFPIY